MLFLFIIIHVAFAGDIKLYSQYDSLLQDKLLIVTKNGLIYNYDLKYQQIRWVSELGVSLQSDGIQNGTYYMRPYRDGSFLFYDDGFYKIEPEDIDLLFRTCSMFQNSLSYNNELMFFLDIATGNIKQLTQYDIQQLLSQPKLYEKGVLIQVQQKYISDLEFEDSQQHNSRIQINFLLKYLRGDKTQTLKPNSTTVEKRKYGVYIEWNNRTIDLYLDDEIFEVFSYTPSEGLFSIFIDEEQNFSTSLTVSSISQNQCELQGQCQPVQQQAQQALGIYKPSQFQLCLNAFYKIKFQNQLMVLETKQPEKLEQCEVVQDNNVNIVIIVLLVIMLIAYLPIFRKQTKETVKKQKEIVIVKEPKVQYIYIKQKEIQIYKDKILGRGCNGTTVYEGLFQGKEVAVKEINLKNLSNKIQSIIEESINQQIQLSSSQIIKLYFFEKRNEFLYLAMEKCQLCLREFVKCDSCDRLTIQEKKSIKLKLQEQQFFKECLKDFLYAIQVIMEKKIIHYGLTPNNILFNSEYKIKLADFGLSNISEYYQEVQEKQNQNPLKNYTVLQQVGFAFFYLLTRGDDQLYKHQVEERILEDRFKKNNIQNLILKDILYILILDQTNNDPTSLLVHPYFWSNQRKLSFICEFSDYVETFQLLPGQMTFQDRCIQNKVFKDNWGTKCEMLLKCQIRGYDQTSAQQLVRLIRNTKNHYHQLTEDCKMLLGPTDETCFDYWDSLYPNLFFTMYEHAKTNKLNLLSLK